MIMIRVNDKDILRVSKIQPRPVAKNATPRPSVRTPRYKNGIKYVFV